MAKKLLKKLKKGLPLLALGLGAAALGRNKRLRATDAPGNAMAKAKRAMTSDRAYTGSGYDDAIMRKQPLSKPFANFDMFDDPNFAAAEGGRAMKSKGGRVTGAAKRGFGRALMKGKK